MMAHEAVQSTKTVGTELPETGFAIELYLTALRNDIRRGLVPSLVTLAAFKEGDDSRQVDSASAIVLEAFGERLVDGLCGLGVSLDREEYPALTEFLESAEWSMVRARL
jgi:hypothetical protein